MYELVEIKESQNENLELASIRNLSEKEIELLIGYNDRLSSLHSHAYIKHNFDIAYRFFNDYFSLFSITPMSTGNFDETILYRIKIYLNSGLEFVDTLEKSLSKVLPSICIRKIMENGKEKDKPKTQGEWLLRDASAKVYDSCFSYRLAYNLRNYLQHVSSEGISFKKNNEKQTIMLDLHKYKQLHQGIQGALKKEIDGISERNIDVIDLCEKYKRNINEIYDLVFSEIDKCTTWEEFELSLKIMRIMESYECKPNGKYALADIYEDDAGEKEIRMTIKLFNYEDIRKFVSMHCKIFAFSNPAIPLTSTNGFPRLTLVRNIQVVFEGSEYVKSDFTWHKIYQSSNYGTEDNHNYFSIYCPAFFTNEETQQCVDIIKKVYGITQS